MRKISFARGVYLVHYLFVKSVEIFNARRINDPGNTTPLGGQFVNSWIEVDFVLVPEPSTGIGALALAGFVPMRACARRSRNAPGRQR